MTDTSFITEKKYQMGGYQLLRKYSLDYYRDIEGNTE